MFTTHQRFAGALIFMHAQLQQNALRRVCQSRVCCLLQRPDGIRDTLPDELGSEVGDVGHVQEGATALEQQVEGRASLSGRGSRWNRSYNSYCSYRRSSSAWQFPLLMLQQLLSGFHKDLASVCTDDFHEERDNASPYSLSSYMF